MCYEQQHSPNPRPRSDGRPPRGTSATRLAKRKPAGPAPPRPPPPLPAAAAAGVTGNQRSRSASVLLAGAKLKRKQPAEPTLPVNGGRPMSSLGRRQKPALSSLSCPGAHVRRTRPPPSHEERAREGGGGEALCRVSGKLSVQGLQGQGFGLRGPACLPPAVDVHTDRTGRLRPPAGRTGRADRRHHHRRPFVALDPATAPTEHVS